MTLPKLSLLLALAAVLAAAGLCLAQEEIIVLNSEALGAHERPLVRFTHNVHEQVIECQNCHHDPDQYFNNAGPAEVKCSECHQAEAAGDNRLSLMEAMHTNCKGCHEGMIARGFASGPVTCGNCHVRGAAAPEKKADGG